jgi:hypothetical protein
MDMIGIVLKISLIAGGYLLLHPYRMDISLFVMAKIRKIANEI